MNNSKLNLLNCLRITTCTGKKLRFSLKKHLQNSASSIHWSKKFIFWSNKLTNFKKMRCKKQIFFNSNWIRRLKRYKNSNWKFKRRNCRSLRQKCRKWGFRARLRSKSIQKTMKKRNCWKNNSFWCKKKTKNLKKNSKSRKWRNSKTMNKLIWE